MEENTPVTERSGGVALRVAAELRPAERDELADLLVAVVADGASVGFLPPLPRADALAYWAGKPAPGTLLLLAEETDRIVGTVQLLPAESANGRHRAEVAKLMVHPAHRRRGLARRLMERLEAEARRVGRSSSSSTPAPATPPISSTAPSATRKPAASPATPAPPTATWNRPSSTTRSYEP